MPILFATSLHRNSWSTPALTTAEETTLMLLSRALWLVQEGQVRSVLSLVRSLPAMPVHHATTRRRTTAGHHGVTRLQTVCFHVQLAMTASALTAPHAILTQRAMSLSLSCAGKALRMHLRASGRARREAAASVPLASLASLTQLAVSKPMTYLIPPRTFLGIHTSVARPTSRRLQYVLTRVRHDLMLNVRTVNNVTEILHVLPGTLTTAEGAWTKRRATATTPAQMVTSARMIYLALHSQRAKTRSLTFAARAT